MSSLPISAQATLTPRGQAFKGPVVYPKIHLDAKLINRRLYEDLHPTWKQKSPGCTGGQIALVVIGTIALAALTALLIGMNGGFDFNAVPLVGSALANSSVGVAYAIGGSALITGLCAAGFFSLRNAHKAKAAEVHAATLKRYQEYIDNDWGNLADEAVRAKKAYNQLIDRLNCNAQTPAISRRQSATSGLQLQPLVPTPLPPEDLALP